VLLAVGSFYWSRAREGHKRTEKFNWMKPVPSETQLRSQLTEEQYRITRQSGTETLFRNLYWDNNRPGIYVDVITGEPLFSSADKFDSGMGLPTFSKPISPEHVVEKSDTSHDMQRTELRANRSNSHLGHLFVDERSPTGRRYLVNSAAMRFIPLEKLEEEGYADFLALFPKPEEKK
jgi:peptide methionine sulfoxide reductase msrA/msrB